MSAGVAIPWADANQAALELVGLLDPGCERISVAGSLRRGGPEVHDIEIVAIPRTIAYPLADLWGNEALVNGIEDRITSLIELGWLAARDVSVNRKDGTTETQRRMGPSYKALVYNGLPVDLFVTDAERWGCIFALRTGPADWNTRLVTDCKRYFRSVADGRVLHLGRPVSTPEEADFFRALGIPWRAAGQERGSPHIRS